MSKCRGAAGLQAPGSRGCILRWAWCYLQSPARSYPGSRVMEQQNTAGPFQIQHGQTRGSRKALAEHSDVSSSLWCEDGLFKCSLAVLSLWHSFLVRRVTGTRSRAEGEQELGSPCRASAMQSPLDLCQEGASPAPGHGRTPR